MYKVMKILGFTQALVKCVMKIKEEIEEQGDCCVKAMKGGLIYKVVLEDCIAALILMNFGLLVLY